MGTPVRRRATCQAGSTLIEVLIASAVMVTLMAGLMSMGAVALSTTENQGHLSARTAEYAQDKLEQLLALAFTDATSDTTTFPSSTTGGTGLVVGGSSNPSSPVAKYVDWLDQNGNLCGSTGAACAAPVGTAAPSSWFYERVWQIADVSSGCTNCLKQISVTVTISRAFAGAMKASSSLTVLKTSPF
jgi:Tfp pilus assembly protein PilV